MREKAVAKLIKAVAGSRKLNLKDLKKVRPSRKPDIISSPVTYVDPKSRKRPLKPKPTPLPTTMEYKRKNGMSKNPVKPSMRGDIPASKKSQMGFGDDVSRSRDPILQRHVNTAAKIAIGGAGFAAGSAWSEHKRKQRGY